MLLNTRETFICDVYFITQVVIITVPKGILKVIVRCQTMSITTTMSLLKQSMWKAVTKPRAQSHSFRQATDQKPTRPLT